MEVCELKESKPDYNTKSRGDALCPKCKEWELNEMGICNHCDYREPSK